MIQAFSILALLISVGCSSADIESQSRSNTAMTLPTDRPAPGEIAEAKLNPGGWVYRIVGDYGPDDAVPPEAIAGAWQVGDDGVIVGDFKPNDNYKPPAER